MGETFFRQKRIFLQSMGASTNPTLGRRELRQIVAHRLHQLGADRRFVQLHLRLQNGEGNGALPFDLVRNADHSSFRNCSMRILEKKEF